MCQRRILYDGICVYGIFEKNKIKEKTNEQLKEVKPMRIKKEYKTLIPPLSPEEYQYLEENILKDGVREPLVVWGDILIDGHNRYEICQKHGITYKTVNKDFESDEEAERWIILNQFGRRNLTKFQRSELALKLKPMLAAQAKERQKIYCGNQYDKKSGLPQNSAKVQKGETREDIAKIAGVSNNLSVWSKFPLPFRL